MLHKQPGEVFVINGHCEYSQCSKYPTFGPPETGEVLFCKDHKQVADIEIDSVLSMTIQKAALRQYELSLAPPLLRECDKLATERMGQLLSSTFHKRKKQEYKCAHGHHFALNYKALCAGSWCPECSLLKTAELAAEHLANNKQRAHRQEQELANARQRLINKKATTNNNNNNNNNNMNAIVHAARPVKRERQQEHTTNQHGISTPTSQPARAQQRPKLEQQVVMPAGSTQQPNVAAIPMDSAQQPSATKVKLQVHDHMTVITVPLGNRFVK